MEDEKKTISVAYRPQPGDPETTEAYGRAFKAGEFVELDPEFADRARKNPSFEVQGEKTFGDPVDKPAEDIEPESDLSFDEAVAVETAQEYGTDDPEAAEQIRRARQFGGNPAALPRNEALSIVKKRGRPRKEDTPPVDEDAAARAAQVDADQAEIERQQTAEREAEAEQQRRLTASQAVQ